MSARYVAATVALAIALTLALTTVAYVAGHRLGSAQSQQETELWKRDANMWLDKLDKCEGWP